MTLKEFRNGVLQALEEKYSLKLLEAEEAVEDNMDIVEGSFEDAQEGDFVREINNAAWNIMQCI